MMDYQNTLCLIFCHQISSSKPIKIQTNIFLGATTGHALNRSMRMLLQNSFLLCVQQAEKMAIFAKINR